jgi:hypothetical protein
MARAIIRYSLQSGQIPLRNQLRYDLEGAGFRRIGTATFEAEDADLPSITAAIADAMSFLGSARLDNLWVYIDQPGRYVD